MKKLHLLCSKDSMRPALNHVKVTKEYCVATDAHVLAAIPTHLIFDEDFIIGLPDKGVFIHSEDWKKMTTGINIVWKSDDVIRVIVKNKRDVLIEVETEDSVGGTYPNWDAVIPSDDASNEVAQVGVNAPILSTLQTALGYGSLKLSFSGQNKPIRVSDGQGIEEGVNAIIMPVQIKN